MRKQKLQDNELDKVGNRLLAAARLSESEAEVIAASQYLYSAIRSKINAPDEVRQSLVTRRMIAVASGSLAVVAVFVTLVIFPNAEATSIAVRSVDAPKQQSVSSAPAKVKEGDSLVGTEDTARNLEKSFGPQIQTALLKKTKDVPARERRAAKEVKRNIEFYPINYAGDPSEMSRGRVIRVEMPRASLFAMGINVPLENASELVKADLLVGADGVTRAVRIVD